MTFDLDHPVFGGPAAEEAAQPPEVRLLVRTVDGALRAHARHLVVTPEAVVLQEPSLLVEDVRQVMTTRRFREAMSEAGVELNARGLSAEQRAFIAVWCNPDLAARPKGEKLRAAGVSPQKYAGWRKQRAFLDELNQTIEETFSEVRGDGLLALQAQVEAGDMRAIKLALEVSGRHDPEGALVQMQQVLRGIYMILDQGLKDHPKVMAQVGRLIEEKLPSLMAGGRLLSTTPSAPEESQQAPAPAPTSEPLVLEPGPLAQSAAEPAIIADEWVVDLSAPNLTPPDQR